MTLKLKLPTEPNNIVRIEMSLKEYRESARLSQIAAKREQICIRIIQAVERIHPKANLIWARLLRGCVAELKELENREGKPDD